MDNRFRRSADKGKEQIDKDLYLRQNRALSQSSQGYQLTEKENFLLNLKVYQPYMISDRTIVQYKVETEIRVNIQQEKVMKSKIGKLVLASVLLLAMGWAYATPPGHEEEHGRGHANHMGNGFGHDKHDTSNS